MTDCLGLNGATLPGTDLLSAIKATGEAGFAFFEPRVPLLLDAEARGEDDQAKETLVARDLAWLPLNALEGVFELDPASLLARADPIFALARRFGIHQLIVVPGRQAQPLRSPAQAGPLLSTLIGEAQRYNIGLLYEPIGFAAYAFPTLRETLAIWQATRLPLVLDTFHLAISEARPADIAALPADAIGLVHLSDALTEGKALSAIRDRDRVLPGEGGLPLRQILEAIRRTGYGGPISVEVFHPKYGELNPLEMAQEAKRQAQSILLAAGWEA